MKIYSALIAAALAVPTTANAENRHFECTNKTNVFDTDAGRILVDIDPDKKNITLNIARYNELRAYTEGAIENMEKQPAPRDKVTFDKNSVTAGRYINGGDKLAPTTNALQEPIKLDLGTGQMQMGPYLFLNCKPTTKEATRPATPQTSKTTTLER